MFDSIRNLVSGVTPDMKISVQVVLYFLVFIFSLRLGSTAMKFFSDTEWGDGLKYVGATIATFIIPAVAIIILYTTGTKTDNDLNREVNTISALIPIADIYLVSKFPENEQLG